MRNITYIYGAEQYLKQNLQQNNVNNNLQQNNVNQEINNQKICKLFNNNAQNYNKKIEKKYKRDVILLNPQITIKLLYPGIENKENKIFDILFRKESFKLLNPFKKKMFKFLSIHNLYHQILYLELCLSKTNKCPKEWNKKADFLTKANIEFLMERQKQIKRIIQYIQNKEYLEKCNTGLNSKEQENILKMKISNAFNNTQYVISHWNSKGDKLLRNMFNHIFRSHYKTGDSNLFKYEEELMAYSEQSHKFKIYANVNDVLIEEDAMFITYLLNNFYNKMNEGDYNYFILQLLILTIKPIFYTLSFFSIFDDKTGDIYSQANSNDIEIIELISKIRMEDLCKLKQIGAAYHDNFIPFISDELIENTCDTDLINLFKCNEKIKELKAFYYNLEEFGNFFDVNLYIAKIKLNKNLSEETKKNIINNIKLQEKIEVKKLMQKVLEDHQILKNLVLTIDKEEGPMNDIFTAYIDILDDTYLQTDNRYLNYNNMCVLQLHQLSINPEELKKFTQYQ